jgi:hypothetical protein
MSANGLTDEKWRKKRDEIKSYKDGLAFAADTTKCKDACRLLLTRPERRLSAEEVAWIYAYATDAFGPINCMLHNVHVPRPEWAPDAFEKINSGLQKLSTNSNEDLFRGTRLAQAPTENSYIRSKSYLSTTTRADLAAKFAEELMSPPISTPQSYILWFNKPGPESASIALITPRGAEEGEKLIKPDACWKVTRVSPTNNLKTTNPFGYGQQKQGKAGLFLVQLDQATNQDCERAGSGANQLAIEESFESQVDAAGEIDELEAQVQELEELIE